MPSICRLNIALFILLAFVVARPTLSDDAEDKGAVYEFLKTSIKINGNKFKTTRRARLQILNARGEEHARFYAWEGRWTKLKNVSITVSSAGGNVLYQRNKNDLTKTCGVSGYDLYSDVCHYYAELKAPAYPFTIEYSYETQSQSLFELRGASLQQEIPVDLAEVRLEVDSDLPLRWKVTQTNLRPTVKHDGNKIEYLWSAVNLEGLDDIEYVPTGYNEPTRLILRVDKFKLEDYSFDGGDWSSVGKFYSDLAADRYFPIQNLPPTLEIDQQYASLRTIYEDLIGSTRYVAIQIGIGGWQPYSAELTQSRGFGDCKDLTTLLISRLRQTGIDAYPALLNTRSNQITDPDFPSLAFDHVIAAAMIGTDTIWLDPTCDLCPLYEIPYTDEDIDVLLMTDQGSRLTHIPKQSPEKNLETRKTLIKIGSDRSVTFETTIQIIGEYATRLRYRISRLTTDETKLFYRDLFADSKRKFGITSYNIENLEEINQPLIIKLTGRRSRRADKIKDQIYCQPMFLDQPGSYENTSMKNRTLPINMYYPDRLEHQITIQWDPNLNISSVASPPDIHLISSFGSLSFVTEADSLDVTIKYEKEYNDYQIETDELDEFREFQMTLKRIAKQYVTLKQ